MKRLSRAWLALVVVCLAGAFAPVRAEGPISRPVLVLLDASGPGLDLLEAMRIDVDAVGDGVARVYVTDEEIAKLRQVGFRLARLPHDAPRMAERWRDAAPPDHREKLGIPTAYHTHATLTSHLQGVVADHPDIARVFSIGTSEQGRELWIVKISRNPDVEEDEPEFSYISSMHGDEVIGKELLIGLIDHLTDGYGSDPRVTAIVDTTEVWLMPSMNPDGTELGWRQNASGVDLNRDFPDQFVDPNNTIVGRAAETAAVMLWQGTVSVDLSANLHGGATVVNYPFDAHPDGFNGFPSPTPDPDDALFISLSLTYADNNSRLANLSPFPDGITNGSDWYSVYGGMQDWFYVWTGRYDVLVELGNTKWPPAADLPSYWTENLEAMLAYLERVHGGVRGIVTDAMTGAPLPASLFVDDNPYADYTDPDVGDYHRILLPGEYALTVESPGYETALFDVEVVDAGSARRYDVALTPLPVDIQATQVTVLDGGNGALEPGEAAELAVTMRNLGLSVTSVGGVLEPTGWHAEVTRALASFPDMATGAAVQSLPPHFAVELDADVPAGHRPGFVVRWQADGASGVTAPFFLEIGEPICRGFAASDLPRAVPDLGTVTSELAIAEALRIEELRVTVDIRHTYRGDLRLLLHSPAGTTVLLHDRGGGGADDIVGTYPTTLAPEEPLAPVSGESSAGSWTLEVQDAGPGNVGTIEAFGIEVCGRPVEATPPEMRFAGLRPDRDGVGLEWWPYPGLTAYRVYRATDPSSAASFIDVTASDDDPTDTVFVDAGSEPIVYWLVTGVGPNGEGPLGHFGNR